MQTLIDKLKKAPAATNIATVGFKTLVCVLANGTAEASNYTGTKAEADTILAGTTVKMSAASDGSNPHNLDNQYVKVRTQAGTKNAFLEIVLTDAYVASITLPTGLTRVVDLLTLPSNSEV